MNPVAIFYLSKYFSLSSHYKNKKEQMKTSGNFNMTATTFSGLEEILAFEIKNLGGGNVQTARRAVTFEGDLGFLYKANLSLRTALRILVPIKSFRATNEKQLYSKARKINWNDYLTPDQTFAIDFAGASDVFRHSQYASQVIKDAIVDRIRNDQGSRPSIDRDNPDIRINLLVSGDKIILSLDSSGQPLFKRGYRIETGIAPINEVLAAGILLAAGWDGKGNYLDPMCGSGTFLIEAAMIACQIPPQLNRKDFAFMNWPNYDKKLFEFIKETRINRIKSPEGEIIGYDTNIEVLESAQRNINQADLADFITLKKQDFFESKKEHFPVLLVFNPPYNERIQTDNQIFYKKIGDTLKQHYPNTWAWFITSDFEALKHVGLRPSKKIPLYNGKLECKLVKYELYEGSKKAKYNL
ncbi:ribosomal RNA large subunit methyltransferase K/L [Flavobacteriaceae bacterium UJ101]|nr:ribosomal RNA large subunit methyltransferase K/L [Flavobacteriaceae bacterium UJ101]